MPFNFTIFLCFSNIRNHLSNFNYLVYISCKIFHRSRFYLFLKTENSRRVVDSRSVCVGLKGLCNVPKATQQCFQGASDLFWKSDKRYMHISTFTKSSSHIQWYYKGPLYNQVFAVTRYRALKPIYQSRKRGCIITQLPEVTNYTKRNCDVYIYRNFISENLPPYTNSSVISRQVYIYLYFYGCKTNVL
jgi:hypothetical protein